MSNVTHRSLRRIRLDLDGYKLLWEVETVNHAGDITTVSSWVPKNVPANKYSWGYEDSVYNKDIVLVERFAIDGYTISTSTYVHGGYNRVMNEEEELKRALGYDLIDVPVESEAIEVDAPEKTPEELEQPLIERYTALTGASSDSIMSYLAYMEEGYEFDHEKAAEFMEAE
jgi:hypothetical protein